MRGLQDPVTIGNEGGRGGPDAGTCGNRANGRFVAGRLDQVVGLGIDEDRGLRVATSEPPNVAIYITLASWTPHMSTKLRTG